MYNTFVFEEALAEHPLYLILDKETSDRYGGSIVSTMTGAIRAGVRLFQVRSKVINQELYRQIDECKMLAEKSHCFLAINDHLELANTYELPVHLGQEDLKKAEQESLLQYGLSTHNNDEIKESMKVDLKPLYIGFGSCFQTQTKTGTVLQSKQSILEATEASSLPLVFIGGITLDNVRELPFHQRIGFAIINDLFRFGTEENDIEYYCYSFKSRVTS